MMRMQLFVAILGVLNGVCYSQQIEPASEPRAFTGPILVGAPLAEQSKPATPCPAINEADINPETIMPYTGWKPVFTLHTNATRNFTCQADLSLAGGIFSAATSTGDFETLWYFDQNNLGIGRLYLPGRNQAPEALAGTIWVDPQHEANYPELSGPDKLPWNRRQVFMITGPLVPYAMYRTRVNTTGGIPPAKCTNAQIGTWVPIPYTADIVFWTCE